MFKWGRGQSSDKRAAPGGGTGTGTDPGRGTKATGDAAEDLALAYLQARGLRLVRRNYRVARGPGARGGEIDLIMLDTDGTLVFVEVRARSSDSHGGAAASVSAAKQRALVFTAQHFLAGLPALPACRFDVVAVSAGQMDWIRGAFSA